MPEALIVPNEAPPVSAPAAPPNGQPEPGGFAAYDMLAGLGKDNDPGDKMAPDPAPEPKPDAPAPNPDQGRQRGTDGKFLPIPEEKKQPQPPEKPAEKAPEQTKPEPEKEKKAGELRKLYDQYKADNARLKSELDAAKKAASEPRPVIEDPEKKTLKETLAHRERRLAELDEKLKYTDYSQSDEFKEKYQKPVIDAYMDASKSLAEFETMEVKDPDTGEITQPSRQLNGKDFDELMSLPIGKAAQKLGKMLDPVSAAAVIADMKQIHRLNAAQKQALEEFRKTGAEKQKQSLAQQEADADARLNHFEAAKKWGRDKYKDWFSPDPEDPKSQEVLDKAEHMATRAYSNGEPLRDGDKPLTPQQLTELQAAIYNQAVGFSLMQRKNNRLNLRVAELETKLKGFEGSVPGTGEANGKAPPEQPGDHVSDFAAFANKHAREMGP